MKRISKTLLLFTVFFYLFAGQATGQIEKSTAPPVTTDFDFPCPPEEIKITKFNGGKNWKIVVNRPFDYKATPKNGTDNWTWALGDLNAAGDGVDTFWQFQNPLNAYSGTGLIPLANLPPNNADFGPAHGHIQATANLNGVPKKDLSDPPGETVKVFFNKDEVHPVSGVPNWFYYWSKVNIIQDQLNSIPGIKLFNISTCSFDEEPTKPQDFVLQYNPGFPVNPPPGLTSFGQNWFPHYEPVQGIQSLCPGENDRIVAKGYYPEGNKIEIGPGCGTVTKETAHGNIISGIHVFYGTVVHEVEHAIIDCEIWTDGYDRDLDMDVDGYRDDWELFFNMNIPPGAPPCIQFDLSGQNNNAYSGAYMPNLLGNCPNLNYSAGTEYEEWRCRDREANLNFDLINDFDWSFDPSFEIQGKNW